MIIHTHTQKKRENEQNIIRAKYYQKQNKTNKQTNKQTNKKMTKHIKYSLITTNSINLTLLIFTELHFSTNVAYRKKYKNYQSSN